MHETTLIRNARVLEPGRGVFIRSLLFRNGRVAAADAEGVPEPAASVDAQGRLLTPGLIDVHTHGMGLCLYERDAGRLDEAAVLLASQGVTCVIPTLVPNLASGDAAERIAALADAAAEVRGIRMPGLHLEGPFVALSGAACRPEAGDVALLDALLDAGRERVRVMSIAPDVPGIIPVIERLVQRGVVPFITHTRADCEQTQRAIDAGARHATHFYDVFHLPASADGGVRPVGAVETLLGDPRCTVDFIADGVHVHPHAVRAALAAKGWAGIVLITDSNVGAAMPEGRYDTPWGFHVRVRPGGGARIDEAGHPSHGALAGSSLTMPQGMANLMRWFDLEPEQVWAMGTANPARLLRLEGLGTLAPGAHADAVLWDETESGPRSACTWVGGRIVWERISQPA